MPRARIVRVQGLLTPRLRVVRVSGVGDNPARPRARLVRVSGVGDAAVRVAPIFDSPTLEPGQPATVTAVLESGAPGTVTWAWRQVSGPTIGDLTTSGATATFTTPVPPPPNASTVVLGVTATIGGVTSPEVLYSFQVLPGTDFVYDRAAHAQVGVVARFSGGDPAPPSVNLLAYGPPPMSSPITVNVDDTSAKRHINLGAGVDAYVVLPNTPVTDISQVKTYESLVTVQGGRNVVVVGGHIAVPKPAPTQLTAAIPDGTSTTVQVASTAAFPASGMARIEGELITYTSKDATHLLGVTRSSGFYNTSAVSSNTVHPVGAAVYVSERQRSAISFKGQTGTVHLEGVLIDGFPCDGVRVSSLGGVQAGRLQMQNCRIEGVSNYDTVYETDGHPDGVQAYGGGFTEVYMGRCSIILDTNGNGFLNKGSDSAPSTPVARWTIADSEIVAPAGDARSMFADTDGATTVWTITNSKLRYPPAQNPVVISRDAARAAQFAQVPYNPADPDVTPAAEVGIGYVPPGYVS